MDYISLVIAALIFAIIVVMLMLLLENNNALKKSNDKVFEIDSKILEKVEMLTQDDMEKKKLMNRILESVQKNERETSFLDKKVDLLTQNFYERILKIEQEIKDIKEKIKNGNI